VLFRSDVMENPGSNTGTVRIMVRRYAALLSSRRPQTVGKVSGTGLAAPLL